MIELKQALQSVRVAVRDCDGRLKLRRLPIGVRAVMTELGLAVPRGREHEPVLMSARQIAERAGRDVNEARAIRRGLRDAEDIGLIRRIRSSVGQIGSHAAWPALVHPALIAAAQRAQPYHGADLIFPRAWDDADPEQPPRNLVTWPVRTTGAVETAGRKGSRARPPPRRATVVAASQGTNTPKRACEPAGDRVKSASAPFGGAGGVEMRMEKQSMRINASAFAGLVSTLGRRQPEPASDGGYIDNGGTAFWDWLAKSCKAAGWSGRVEFVGQRRLKTGPKAGQRGGQVLLGSADLQHAVDGCSKAGAEAARRDDMELTFRMLEELHPVLLLDDLGDPARIAHLPAILVETSPGGYQATFVAARSLSQAERVTAQGALVARFGGDAGALSGKQLRRPPGSRNRKPDLATPFVARLVHAPNPGVLENDLLDELLAPREVIRPAAGAGTSPRQRHAFASLSGSHQDWSWVMQQLGKLPCPSRDQLITELAEHCALRNRHGAGSDPAAHRGYAVRTVDKAVAVRAGRRAR